MINAHRSLIVAASVLLVILIVLYASNIAGENKERQRFIGKVFRSIENSIRCIDGYFTHPDTFSYIEECGLHLMSLYFTIDYSNNISSPYAITFELAGKHLLLNHNPHRYGMLDDGIVSDSEEELLRELAIALRGLLMQFAVNDNTYKANEDLSYVQINAILRGYHLDFFHNDYFMQYFFP